MGKASKSDPWEISRGIAHHVRIHVSHSNLWPPSFLKLKPVQQFKDIVTLPSLQITFESDSEVHVQTPLLRSFCLQFFNEQLIIDNRSAKQNQSIATLNKSYLCNISDSNLERVGRIKTALDFGCIFTYKLHCQLNYPAHPNRVQLVYSLFCLCKL